MFTGSKKKDINCLWKEYGFCMGEYGFCMGEYGFCMGEYGFSLFLVITKIKKTLRSGNSGPFFWNHGGRLDIKCAMPVLRKFEVLAIQQIPDYPH